MLELKNLSEDVQLAKSCQLERKMTQKLLCYGFGGAIKLQLRD